MTGEDSRESSGEQEIKSADEKEIKSAGEKEIKSADEIDTLVLPSHRDQIVHLRPVEALHISAQELRALKYTLMIRLLRSLKK